MKSYEELEDERDALAALCEEAASTIEMLDEHTHPGIECDATAHGIRARIGADSTTSLARRDAAKQVEALERLKKCQVTDNGVRLVVGRDLEKHLAEYRRQAEGGA